jgi:hypothetical protein
MPHIDFSLPLKGGNGEFLRLRGWRFSGLLSAQDESFLQQLRPAQSTPQTYPDMMD